MKKIIFRMSALLFAPLFVTVFAGNLTAQNEEKSNQGIDQIKSELSSKTISIDIKDTPFREVINLIRQRVSFNIIIDDAVDQKLQGGAAGGGAAGAGGDDGGGFGNNAGGGGFGNNNAGGGGGGFGNNNSGGGGGFGNNNSGGGGGFGNNNSGGGGGFGNNNSGGNSGGGFGNNNSGGGGFDSNNSGGGGGFGNNNSGGGGFGNNNSGGGGGFGNNNSGGGGFGNNNSDGGFGGGGNNAGGGFGGGGGAAQQPVGQNVTISLEEVTIERALKIILSMKDLTAVFKNGVVHIVPKDNARQFDIRFYDVRDVQYELEDFPGPKLRFRAGESSQGSGGSGGSNQRFIGGQLFNESQGGGKDIITNEEEFMKLIKNNVGSQQDWSGKASMRMTSGILVVNQTPDVHEQISYLINRLRQFK